MHADRIGCFMHRAAALAGFDGIVLHRRVAQRPRGVDGTTWRQERPRNRSGPGIAVGLGRHGDLGKPGCAWDQTHEVLPHPVANAAAEEDVAAAAAPDAEPAAAAAPMSDAERRRIIEEAMDIIDQN